MIMNTLLFEELYQDFDKIIAVSSNKVSDKSTLKTITDHLTFAKKELNNNFPYDYRRLLTYCIDTMVEIVKEKNNEKTCEFAVISKLVTQIYLKKRFFHSLKNIICDFRKKWGEQYFPEFKAMYKNSVNSAPRFINKEEEKEFKKKSKSAAFIGVFLYMLFSLGYLLYVTKINPAPNEWPILLGGIGSLLLPLGLLNAFSAKLIAMDKIFTYILTVCGASLIIISFVLLYR